jgi:hypothetical protein
METLFNSSQTFFYASIMSKGLANYHLSGQYGIIRVNCTKIEVI